MRRHHIDAQTSAEIDRLVDGIIDEVPSVHDAGFHRKAAVLAHELPRGLREALVDFRLTEDSGALLVSGTRVDDKRIGPTPAHWHQPPSQVSPELREEIIFALCAQLLGDPFGYATLHNGRLMHNIIPIKGHEQEQIASGSSEPLEWHTEEAFHRNRSAYTALMCLRNPYRAPTTYVDIADLDITAEDAAILRQPLFETRPSGSHSAQRNEFRTLLPESEQARAAISFQNVAEITKTPVVQPILFGDESRPYLCLDPDCMTPISEEAAGAMRRLCTEVNRKIQDVALAPGDLLFIDNYRAVHGRKPFQARFDGTDRWLKRINITRDLRPSRALRLSANARVIY
jgi:Fe(II)/alpha-ketoglutarate-dependent arginine beta-hydroxylase